MAADISAGTINQLSAVYDAAQTHRSMRVGRYDVGHELVVDATGVVPAKAGRVRMVVERFVGGGFAGQVYRVKVVDIEAAEPIAGLAVGGVYAVKILIPPSGRSRLFRDMIYKLGFQAPFALQANPAAARAGALWQKFIRRAAEVKFGDEQAVVDVLATFVDTTLGSCGEISQWLEGRTWRFEVDEHLTARRRWRVGRDEAGLGSPEYRAKKTFMAEFVKLLHEVGAQELARQYEWWTCKSQPNALKRVDTENQPDRGLTAVDFRAGLALLAVLPMSPGDVKLIFKGLARGSLVQFDRGNIAKLEAFVDSDSERFADMRDALAELKETDRQYRNSQIDITHNHVRLLYSRRLWSTILDAAATGWDVRNITDEPTTAALKRSHLLTLAFAAVCLVPLVGMVGAAAGLVAALVGGAALWPAVAVAAGSAVAAALFGRALRKLCGRGDYRRHVRAAMTSAGYFRRAFRAHVSEKLIGWVRQERVSGGLAIRMSEWPWLFLFHWPLSLLPVRLHRVLIDRSYAAEMLRYIFVRPIRLYFDHSARERWLRDMVAEGQRRHMLTDEDAATIISRIEEPFIQKYLKSLAVHVCTLPVTQIVSVAIAIWYWRAHPELSTAEAWAAALVILGIFQIIPISPGSMVRGLYVLYLVLRERNFKDYNIAVFLGFFKYVGYLAFPIQMTYRYPVLARFMAAHWATGAVHVVPVFGEHGALLEHAVFDLFYNYPLTVRRRMGVRAGLRSSLRPRAWHGLVAVIGGLVVLGVSDAICQSVWGALPKLSDIWPVVAVTGVLLGAVATIGAGGMAMARRIRLATLCGLILGVGYGGLHAGVALVWLAGGYGGEMVARDIAINGLWSTFVFALVSTVAALLTEISLPEPVADSATASGAAAAAPAAGLPRGN